MGKLSCFFFILYIVVILVYIVEMLKYIKSLLWLKYYIVF